ncbi:uncharacterized protein [Paramisgurnus dabryanus]|uniref:uncharacterized protein n=1 Tax=Paramisgurnus dabryanus TaxID=90735 RepID=UPI0031F39B00
MHQQEKAPFLFILGLALAFEGGQCWEHEVVGTYGSVVVLPCRDETSLLSHPTTVYWSKMINNVPKSIWRREKNGIVFRPVKNPPHIHCPNPNFGKADYSLQILGMTDEDVGLYTCEVQGQIRMRKVIMLRIIKVLFSPALVVEGSRTEITCKINPQPEFQIRFRLNGSVTYRKVLYEATQRDSGNWTCQVSYNDVVGKATKYLEVKGISTPPDDSLVLYAAVGSSVALPCLFSEGLDETNVSWERSSTTENSPLPSSFKQSPTGSPVLFGSQDRSAWIETVQDGDEGKYTCSGIIKRSNGTPYRVQRRMQLVVARVLRSSSSSKTGQMSLTCHLSDPSQVTSYEWLHVTYGINDTQTMTLVTKSKILRIQKLTEQEIGEWVCRYYGKDGFLGNVTYQIHMTGAQTGESKSTSGRKVGMVMGLGFLFLVIFLILFQMYRNYRRKRKILLYPAMETIVHEAVTERERRERYEARVKESCSGDPKSVRV